MIGKTLRILVLGLLCALLALTVSGCVFQPVDDLYALPALPEQYSDLQANIDSAMSELGAEYAVINYGSNTSTIQLLDLDGDGRQETAAVFLRVTAASGDEKPLRVCLFRSDGDNNYQRAYMLEGEGTSINSVAYEDLTGDGYKELIVSWQMSAGVHILSAYALTSADSNELMNITYNETYLTADLNEDGDREIVVFKQDGSGDGNDRAEYYDFQDGSMVMTSSAPLSLGMRDVVSAQTGLLADGTPGVYVTMEMDEGQVTGILALEDGDLVNLTRDQESGVSLSTFRSYTEVEVTDINSDGVLEVPKPVALRSTDPENTTIQYLIHWQQFDRRGRGAVSCVTYHSTVDGWYLTVPDGWAGNITAARDDSFSARGERAVVFYYWPSPGRGEPEPFLTIYRLTGSNRQARAALPGRFTLYSDSSTIYCAVLDPKVWDCGTDETELVQRFSTITAEWSSQ